MIGAGSYELMFSLLGALACAVLVGCRPSGSGRPLIVVVSGDTAGWIAPCGCVSNQSGGLPRRATYVEGLRRQAEVVVVDVGGAVHGTSPYDLAKLEAILRGEALMGVAAHNVGAAEARFGPATLRRLAAKLAVPLLSANVCDGSGRLVAAPLRIVAAAGRRVALVGVLGERYATADFQVLPPRQAVLEALGGATGKFDAAIVLAYLPEDELRQLAEALPEADVVVGGPTAQPLSPKLLGPTLLCSATNKGKFVARLDAPAPGSADRWTGSIVELNGQFSDDARQEANIGDFRAELARGDFTPQQTAFAEPVPADLPEGVCRRRNGRLPEVPRGRLPGMAEIHPCRRVEIAEGEGGPRRSGVPALPYDRLRAARRVRLGASRRRRGRRWAAKAATDPPRGTSPSRPSAPPISPRPRTTARAATTAKTARSSPTTSTGTRSPTANSRPRKPLAPSLSVRARITHEVHRDPTMGPGGGVRHDARMPPRPPRTPPPRSRRNRPPPSKAARARPGSRRERRRPGKPPSRSPGCRA